MMIWVKTEVVEDSYEANHVAGGVASDAWMPILIYSG